MIIFLLQGGKAIEWQEGEQAGISVFSFLLQISWSVSTMCQGWPFWNMKGSPHALVSRFL